MKNIILIGGSGFIGSRLMSRLRTNGFLNSKIIDKVPSKVFPKFTELCDVRLLDRLKKAIPDGSVIVNLAAEHRDDVLPLSLYDEVNVTGAKNICTVAREKGAQTIIFTSTVAVYGFAFLGTNESGAIAPLMTMVALSGRQNKFINNGNLKTQRIVLLLLCVQQ